MSAVHRQTQHFFEMTIEPDDNGEQSYHVEYVFDAGRPANLYGDEPYPEEPAEIIIFNITDKDGFDVTNNPDLEQIALEQAEEHHEQLEQE